MGLVFQHRRDTAANWTSTDPVLAEGQLGFEVDTLRFKLGDGATVWTSLAYVVTSFGPTRTAGITAVNPPAQGSGPLTTEVNEVSTVVTTGDCVTLPSDTNILLCVVINNAAANACRIYPESSANLGAGTNNPMSIDLAAGDMVTFYRYSDTQWRGHVATMET